MCLRKYILPGLVLSMLSLTTLALRASIQQPGTAQGSAQTQLPQFRVIRSQCGAKGHEVGNDFVVDDPRNVFTVPLDKQVVAFFEWEGPTGLHHFQGTWRSPDGKAISVSNFQYEARESHFRGYWTLTLPENPPAGLWALEATIDGQGAGAQTFRIEIDSSALPPGPLTRAEIYQLATPAMVFVESIDQDGQLINRGTGFFLSPDTIATAFQIIDGASTLQVILTNGSRLRVDRLADWDRASDWVLIKLDGRNEHFFRRAQVKPSQIGDTDYLFDAPKEGGRTIIPIDITGVQNSPGGAHLFNISWAGDLQSIGSPLVNRQGELVGMLAGAPVGPKVTTFNANAIMVNSETPLLVVPIGLVPDSPREGRAETLSGMASKGLFFPPVAHDPLALTGYVCDNYQVGPGGTVLPANILTDVSHKLGTVTVVVIWHPTKNMKITAGLSFFDAQNKKIAVAKDVKVTLRNGDLVSTSWKVPLTSLPNGTYRLDVSGLDRVQWRTYFNVTN